MILTKELKKGLGIAYAGFDFIINVFATKMAICVNPWIKVEVEITKHWNYLVQFLSKLSPCALFQITEKSKHLFNTMFSKWILIYGCGKFFMFALLVKIPCESRYLTCVCLSSCAVQICRIIIPTKNWKTLLIEC